MDFCFYNFIIVTIEQFVTYVQCEDHVDPEKHEADLDNLETEKRFPSIAI